jgi:hypothetical protein
MTTTGASPEADWQAVTDPEASGHSGFQPLTDLGLVEFRGTADELTARADGVAAAGGFPTEHGYSAARS